MSDWQEAYSNNHQRKYWFNTVTGISVWENPNEIQASTAEPGGDAKRRRITDEKDDGKHAGTDIDSEAKTRTETPTGLKSNVGESLDIFEESPIISIEREKQRDRILTAFSEDNEKLGELAGA